jgi:serine/threonine protein kinase
MSASETGAEGACPSESVILGFVEGKADGRALVDGHIASCDACRRLVSVLAGESAATAPRRADEPTPPPFSIKPGAVLANKFEVVSILGRGGMGVVVEAFHRTLGQRVALKFLQGGLAKDPSAVSRFFREARAAASLGSEHVVRVLDADWLPSGEPFLALELLEGRDLAAELRDRGPLDVVEAVGFALQACEALALAHQKGIVHRDIKPANLFLTRAVDGSPLVKVLDFGVAKVRRAGDAGTGTTDPSAIVGSPRYMSPEQIQSSGAVGAPADVWALAVTLYELVSGRAPFEGENLLEICAAIVSGPPARLVDRRADVPPGLGSALERALAKDVGARTASMLAFAEDIASYAGPTGEARLERLRRIARVSQAPSGIKSSSSSTRNEAAAVGVDSTLAASSLGPSRVGARSSSWPWIAGVGALVAAVAVFVATRRGPAEPELGAAAGPPIPATAADVMTAAPAAASAELGPDLTTSPAESASAAVTARATAPFVTPKPRHAPVTPAASAPRPSSATSSPLHRDGLLDRK